MTPSLSSSESPGPSYLPSFFPCDESSKPMAFRPTLRPVDWSDVDSRGRYLRRERSPEDDSGEEDLASPITEKSPSPPRKRKKVFGLPAVYYPPTLSPSEKLWRERYNLLYHRGYILRPRYQPNWTPTLLGNGRHYHSGEDHIMQILPQVLDAIRKVDGLVVCLKMIQEPKKLKQIKITEYFSSRRMIEDSRNHVVPFYAAFADYDPPEIQFMVMPVLRRFDDPEFLFGCEVIDFVSQILEGLVFLHANNVAHHNLIAEHIMMDAKSLVPTGWHFVAPFCEPDGMTRITPLDRKRHPVRYYFIGFGNCFHIPRHQRTPIKGIGGGDCDVPELLAGQAYDPFKLDIYTLANVIDKYLHEKYENIGFLDGLIKYMRTESFEQRPNADMVLTFWYHIRDGLPEDRMEELHLRLRQNNHVRYPSVDSTGATGSRSDKRDISSILNKVLKKPGVFSHHETNL